MARITVKPGKKVPVSGQYKTPGAPYETTLVKGKPAPPTQKAGQVHVLKDETKHKK
jgi:hypothetical protein